MHAGQTASPLDEGAWALVEHSPDAVVVCRRGRLSYLNSAAVALLRAPRAEALHGRRLAELASDAVQRDAVERWLKDVRQADSAAATEIGLRGIDGEALWVDLTGTSLRLAGEEVVQAIVRDVTPRWQRESARILADRVATSTALAAGVAHAINNPLAYILINLDYVRGFLDQLGQLDDSELVEAREALQEAREGAQQVSHIVQALRVFSSEGEEGQWATDLRAVVDSVADLALGAIRQRARLVKVLDPIPLVRGRAASLGQLVLGLVLELVRRLPDEEPRDVEIRLVTRALAGAVVLEVSLGSGAEERAPADGAAPARTRADTDPAGWSPLGIALCRAIACEAGGALTLDGGGDGPAAVRVQLRPALTPVAPA